MSPKDKKCESIDWFYLCPWQQCAQSAVKHERPSLDTKGSVSSCGMASAASFLLLHTRNNCTDDLFACNVPQAQSEACDTAGSCMSGLA